MISKDKYVLDTWISPKDILKVYVKTLFKSI